MGTDVAVDLSELSESELLELMVPVQSMSRRLLVVWMYLQHRVNSSLKDFDEQLSSLAEAELQKRAGDSTTGQKLEQATKVSKKIAARRDSEDSEAE